MSDTIAAISTPIGEGGIGIVRVSGSRALEIMRKVLENCPEEILPRHAYYGKVRDEAGQILDEVLCIYMKAPHSYTCEDVVEFQAHGGTLSLRRILREVLRAGARMAEPGEFTKLAFLNGRIDLTQAEAVIDIIRAKSEVPLMLAEDQLEGRLGREISSIRRELLDLLSQMAVNIDFPDEDIEQFAYEEFILAIHQCLEKTGRLLLTAEEGRIARDGIRTAIVGKPNVGKSSLMNGILRQQRAIVTEIPGTTRDTIEETANIRGVPIILTDTAGIRETDDRIEKIGIERSREELARADLILFVLDSSEALSPEDREIAAELAGRRVLVLLNKQDLEGQLREKEIRALLPEAEVLRTSLLEMEGADPVIEKISEMFLSGMSLRQERAIVSNERHRDALCRAEASLQAAEQLLTAGEPLEIAEIDVHAAYDALGEILGETAGDEILDHVFSKFCLGK
ncbi:MAG: tRNA uridine-5-carboxymethylaminomethyl(34) synthesis GTPase MnmE [Mogibacterium sp.]|nr:tRNA uridine-5-carboxymethylaminomethyl(34) synthesis GTPase MnmE [Mogibacterium sp.]